MSHAQQGHRTLLIDGDLRRPSVHRRFDIPSALGLSNVLVSELPWQDAVVKLPNLPGLDVLPAGPTSRRAADLIGRGLQQMLEEASAEYDLVILDAPPLLGFAEPLQMATVVDGVLVVTRAGETSRKAVASVVAAHYDSVWVDGLAYAAAGLVGLARMDHNAHFASDVLAGAMIGTVVGRTSVRMGDEERKGVAGKTVSFEPWVEPKGTGLVISVGF